MACGSHTGQHSSRLKGKKPNSRAYCFCTEVGRGYYHSRQIQQIHIESWIQLLWVSKLCISSALLLLFIPRSFWNISIVLSSSEELSLLALERYSLSSAQINSSSFVLRKRNLEGYCYPTVLPYANSHCYLFFFL